jgi:hypothetical protein
MLIYIGELVSALAGLIEQVKKSLDRVTASAWWKSHVFAAASGDSSSLRVSIYMSKEVSIHLVCLPSFHMDPTLIIGASWAFKMSRNACPDTLLLIHCASSAPSQTTQRDSFLEVPI